MHLEGFTVFGEVIAQNLADTEPAEIDRRVRAEGAELVSLKDVLAPWRIGPHHWRALEPFVPARRLARSSRLHFQVRARDDRAQTGDARRIEAGSDDPELRGL